MIWSFAACAYAAKRRDHRAWQAFVRASLEPLDHSCDGRHEALRSPRPPWVIRALQEKRWDWIQRYATADDLNAKDHHGFTALHGFLGSEQLTEARLAFLLERGANPHLRGGTWRAWTRSLHVILMQTSNHHALSLRCVHRLLATHHEPNEPNGSGLYPLDDFIVSRTWPISPYPHQAHSSLQLNLPNLSKPDKSPDQIALDRDILGAFFALGFRCSPRFTQWAEQYPQEAQPRLFAHYQTLVNQEIADARDKTLATAWSHTPSPMAPLGERAPLKRF